MKARRLSGRWAGVLRVLCAIIGKQHQMGILRASTYAFSTLALVLAGRPLGSMAADIRHTVRNFSWTTDKTMAEFFAVHRRGHAFPDPVIAHGFTRKADVFAVRSGRESEIILEPRRLRKLTIESVAHIKRGQRSSVAALSYQP